jgi:hypothetical protein
MLLCNGSGEEEHRALQGKIFTFLGENIPILS